MLAVVGYELACRLLVTGQGSGRRVMARWVFSSAMLIALAACSQDGPGRAVITERCIAGGESPEICQCLADESSKILDDDMFDMVVLGALGDDAETDLMMREMSSSRRARFSALMREIIQGCGAEGYVAAS